ncbi:MAG: helix-turn-helix transcriptional regulator [Cyanobacteria bacterium J06638_7]
MGRDSLQDPGQGLQAGNGSQPIRSQPERSLQERHLSERELEIIALVAEGHTNQEIAAQLTISKRTVDNHVSNIFTKTGSKNRVALLNWAMDHGKICRDGFNCCALEPGASDPATRLS